MATRRYEVVYIFDSTLDESQVTQRLERFHALLKSPTSAEPVSQVNHWGKRTLAYPIKRRETGYYVVAKFETEPTMLSEFERAIKLDESVLRYLIVIDEGATPAAVRLGEEVEEEIGIDEEEEDELGADVSEESEE